MKNITFEGISTFQRLHLCWQIRKQIGKIHQPIKVEFHQPICRKQYSSLWYGGLVVSIKVRGCVFAIHACGDIYATLYDKSDGTELLYVKDKSNSGRFGVDVLPYLKTDHALYAAMGDTHKRYRLDMQDTLVVSWRVLPLNRQRILQSSLRRRQRLNLPSLLSSRFSLLCSSLTLLLRSPQKRWMSTCVS